MERITSRNNAQFKQARKLAKSARERSRSRQIFMDGTRLIEAYAVRFGLREVTLLISEHGVKRAEIQQILLKADAGRARLLPAELFADIAQVETPEGICALAGFPLVRANPPDDFRILLEGVQDSGNLGALLRSAAAAGATSAWLAKGCADAWSPKALRGGMGAQFILPIQEHVELVSALASFRGTVIATSPRAVQTIYEVDLCGPVAMIFGGEGRGLPEALLSMATHLVHVPMAANIESLNVAAAAAVCCFERRRQLQHEAPARED
jgi:TrmH family RNA methyltransferase